MNEVGEFGTGLVVGWLTGGIILALVMGAAMWLAGWGERHAVYRTPRRPVVQLAPWLWGEPLDVAPRSSVAASDYGFLLPPFETPREPPVSERFQVEGMDTSLR